MGKLAVVAGISSEVSSGYTVAEETCLEDAEADTSLVDGAARLLQHSSDRCHDLENNNQPDQPMLSEYYPKDRCTRDFNPE